MLLLQLHQLSPNTNLLDFTGEILVQKEYTTYMITESAKFEQDVSNFKTIIHFASTITIPSKNLFLIHTDETAWKRESVSLSIGQNIFWLIENSWMYISKEGHDGESNARMMVWVNKQNVNQCMNVSVWGMLRRESEGCESSLFLLPLLVWEGNIHPDKVTAATGVTFGQVLVAPGKRFW